MGGNEPMATTVSQRAEEWRSAAGVAAAPTVSIIIPARDEEANIGGALAAACASEAAEILVVDDGSSDATVRKVLHWTLRDPRVRLLRAGPLPVGWIGKSHALWRGACAAQGDWLLFLDADARLCRGGLAIAQKLAANGGLDALSISPQQHVVSFAERAVNPLIYRMLSARYPYARVNDPADPCAAANGQFILAQRPAYFQCGGHGAVPGDWLEDVALARLFKQSGLHYRFEALPGVVHTRMYRDRRSLFAGWKKNLFLLFGSVRSPMGAALAGTLLGLIVILVALAAAVGLGAWAAAIFLSSLAAAAHLTYGALVPAEEMGWLQRSTLMIPALLMVLGLWASSERAFAGEGSLEWRGRHLRVNSAVGGKSIRIAAPSRAQLHRHARG